MTFLNRIRKEIDIKKISTFVNITAGGTSEAEGRDDGVEQGDAPGENDSNSDDNEVIDADETEKEKDADADLVKADNPPKAKSK